jgi:hypothetical protein
MHQPELFQPSLCQLATAIDRIVDFELLTI